MKVMPPESLVIVGNDVAAWLAAAVLSKTYGKGTEVILCTDREHPCAPARQPMLPDFQILAQTLGVDVPQFAARCAATYKLADRICAWSSTNADFYHAMGDYGATFGAVEFHQALSRLREAGKDVKPLEAYSLAATSAQLGKFSAPSPDPSSILCTLKVGCNLDTQALRSWLQDLCRQSGVQLIDQVVTQVNIHSEVSTIDKLTLDNGQSLSANLFVDTTREQKLRSSLPGERRSYESDLLARIRYDYSLKSVEDAPISTVSALAKGWQKSVPSQNGITVSAYGASDDVLKEVGECVVEQAVPCAAVLQVQPWMGNCIAVGPAAMQLASPCVSELDLAWLGLSRLLDHLPDAQAHAALAREYNRVVAQGYAHVRNSTRLYFQLSTRTEAFWTDSRKAALSDELHYSLALFKHRGKWPFFENPVLPAAWHVYLCLGLGLWPERVDPLAMAASVSDIEQLNLKIQKAVVTAAANLPEHRAFWRGAND
ncbi:tryptophan 7-halogenase [Marinimicrobium sp. ABcell2]|uniref:tryptophan 7-halogenase n=1 Tax=Marinimicrobium sp. ABcell2 TaxID=3069751 RepID=UPI0027B4A800|nr:tryptophan 7-halogenase [Marinimicrobium sp. ABcell2]MDQ2076044.1 tryptophan 7-halogenase [Marinimicrobium sp. ABcell2]